MNFHQLYENYMLMLYLVKFDYGFLSQQRTLLGSFLRKGRGQRTGKSSYKWVLMHLFEISSTVLKFAV